MHEKEKNFFSEKPKNRTDVVIERVLGTQDPYTILNVSRNVTEVEIDKAYKKLCLVLHPDRCRHKKAEEAFKKLVNAKHRLLDMKKRQSEFSRTDFFKTRNHHQNFDNGVFDSFYRNFDPSFRNSFSFGHRQRPHSFFDDLFEDNFLRRQQNDNFFVNNRWNTSAPNTTVFETDEMDAAKIRFIILIIFILFILFLN